MRTGYDLRADHCPKGGLEKDLVDQRAFSTTRDTGHADDSPEGNGRVDRFQIVCGGTFDGHGVLEIERSSSLGALDASSAREVHAGERILGRLDLCRGSLGNHSAAVLAGTGADVHDVIGLPDDIFVVFDHEHGVADVGEMTKGGDQTIIVTLVQADRWLVEDVTDADQSGSDLGGEADSLGLAAREGSAASVEREVIEPDRTEKAQPRTNLAEDGRRDRLTLGVQLEIFEELQGTFNREVSHLGDVERLSSTIHLDASSSGLEATAPTVRALRSGHVAVHSLPDELAFTGLVSPPQVGQDAFEGESDGLGVFFLDPVEELMKDLLRHGGDGGLGIHIKGLDEFSDQSSVVNVHPTAVLPPRFDGPFLERPGSVRHHELLVELVDGSEARTGGARAVGGVE